MPFVLIPSCYAFPNYRYTVIRTEKAVTPQELAHSAVKLVEVLSESVVKLIFKQKGGLRNWEAFLQICPTAEITALEDYLKQHGYNEGPLPSKDMCIKEGQRLEFSLEPNVAFNDKVHHHRCVFRKNLECTRYEFLMKPDDVFANKGFESYHGKGKLYNLKELNALEFQPEDEPLCTLPINLTKVSLL